MLTTTTDTDNGPSVRVVEAAFFDLDKTVIAKAAMMAFGRPLHRAGYISRWLVVRALYGQLVFRYLGADEARMAKMRETSLRLCRGWDRAKVSALVRETLTEVIEPLVFEEAMDLIESHRAKGHRVYLVSASPEEIVLPLARYLGVDGAIASRAEVDADGRYTGEVEFYSYGPYKADALREEAATWGFDLAESFAYSDSITDLPMLEAVGHPVVVNPDRELRRVALDRGWETRVFERPVALRPTRTVAAPALIGGGTAAVAAMAGAAGWWWSRRTRPRRRPWE